MFRISVLTFCILTVNAVLSQYMHIPEAVYKACPYSNICNRTASLTLNAKGLVPCCKSCGCDTECGLRFDCCFDFLDKYNLTGQQKAACIDPIVGNKAVRLFEEMYYIVQSCNFRAKDNGEPVKFCNKTDQDGNSLVEPVSSQETGYIYINADCAYCNRVWDFRRWNFVFYSGVRVDGSVMWSLFQQAKTDEEARIYVPPTDENWSSMRCYTKPYVSKPCVVRPELQFLCDNFNAPFDQGRSVARNVICEYNCQTNDNEFENKLDRECNEAIKGTLSSNSLMVLVDEEVMAKFSLWKHEQQRLIENFDKDGCSSNTYPTSYGCLQIWCPDAMAMTPDGCKYVVKTWFVNVFFIQIRLSATPNPSLLKSDLYSISDQERTNPLTWIHSPCIQLRPLIVIMYDTIIFNDEGLVESLNIDLWKTTNNNGIQPEIVFSILERCLKSTWSLNVNNKLNYFNSSLESRLNMELYIYLLRNPFGAALALGPGNLLLTMMKAAIPISKTFFCNQVRIPWHDVTQLSPDTILLLSKNITLGNNEYTKNAQRDVDLNKTTYSVCLTDIDPDFNFVTDRNRNRIQSRNGIQSHKRKLMNLMLLLFLLFKLSSHFILEM